MTARLSAVKKRKREQEKEKRLVNGTVNMNSYRKLRSVLPSFFHYVAVAVAVGTQRNGLSFVSGSNTIILNNDLIMSQVVGLLVESVSQALTYLLPILI